jgi:hypothetical protein
MLALLPLLWLLPSPGETTGRGAGVVDGDVAEGRKAPSHAADGASEGHATVANGGSSNEVDRALTGVRRLQEADAETISHVHGPLQHEPVAVRGHSHCGTALARSADAGLGAGGSAAVPPIVAVNPPPLVGSSTMRPSPQRLELLDTTVLDEEDAAAPPPLPPPPPLSFMRELSACLSDPVYMSTVAGYAGFTAVIAGERAFGASSVLSAAPRFPPRLPLSVSHTVCVSYRPSSWPPLQVSGRLAPRLFRASGCSRASPPRRSASAPSSPWQVRTGCLLSKMTR